MKCNTFKESQVREAILKKAPLELKDGKRSPHSTAWLKIDGVYKGHITIPNAHNKDFWEGKAKNIANKLHLTAEQYNDFVKCDLKKKKYEEILRQVS